MKNIAYAIGIAAALSVTSPLGASNASANIQITEWMYNGNADEFIELTNMGTGPVDMSGWKYDDDSRNAAIGLDLSSLGSVAIGESVIISERSAADFSSAWNLRPGTKIIGNNTINLGRADEINIYDQTGALVDRFAYGDVAYPGTIRTSSVSGTPVFAAALIPQTVTTDWVLSSVGDIYGSYASLDGDVGNPGSFIYAPVPEPGTYALMLAGLVLVGAVARRRG